MINVSDIWEDLGYARKGYLVKYLKTHFREGVDYKAVRSSNGGIGRPQLDVFILNEACYDSIRQRSHHQSKNVYREKVYRANLHKLLGGEKDAVTPVGNVDLLTSTEVIEVKAAKDWRSGLGQVLAYSYFFRRRPRRYPRLHLFGECSEDDRALISKICRKYNVKMTWEP